MKNQHIREIADYLLNSKDKNEFCNRLQDIIKSSNNFNKEEFEIRKHRG